MSLFGMVIWHWYALKTDLPEVNISKQSPTMFLKHTASNPLSNGCLQNYVCTTLRPSLHCREAGVQKGNFKQMHPIFIFRYRLEIWHGYTIESTLCSHIRQLNLRVFDAMALRVLTHAFHTM